MKCSKCLIEKLETEFYAKSKKNRHTYCKKCHGDYTKNRFRRYKQQAIEYRGGKCIVCNYSKCIDALDFHHLDPLKKEFSISQSNKSFETLKIELDKCVILCSNCHRELHAKVFTL